MISSYKIKVISEICEKLGIEDISIIDEGVVIFFRGGLEVFRLDLSKII